MSVDLLHFAAHLSGTSVFRSLPVNRLSEVGGRNAARKSAFIPTSPALFACVTSEEKFEREGSHIFSKQAV